MNKIAFLTSTLEYGGATKIMIELANYLSDYFEVSIINYGDNMVFYDIDNSIRVISAPHTACTIPKIRLIKQMIQTRAFLKQYSFDAIIAFGNTEKLLAVYSMIGRKTKVIISERQDPFNYVPGKKHTMWLRYELADGCVFQTVGAMKYFSHRVEKKSVVIPNFIEIGDYQFVPMNKKRKIISFSARFELRQKRQDIMIKAMRIVADLHPDWKLYFWGDGPDKKAAEQMVKKYKLDDNVIFAGKTKNIFDKIYESSIFVLTSEYEGIPNALLEAMAIGIPVVSTKCSPGGAELLIKNDVNGKLTAVNDPCNIASAICEYIDDPVAADKMAINAVDVKNTYSPQKILPLWKQFINRIIGD